MDSKKYPNASTVTNFNRKVQQKDNCSCGPLTIFNIENLEHSKHPNTFDVHIPSKANLHTTRQKCHNMAYLAIKGHVDYNITVSEEEMVNKTDLNAAKDNNWFTENLFNMVTSEIITHKEHVIESTRFFDEYISKGVHNKHSNKQFFKNKEISSLIIPKRTSLV